jgi:hypothetical protein
VRRAIPAILVLVVIGVAVTLWFHRRPPDIPPAASTQIEMSAYGLSVSAKEKQAIVAVLNGC